MECDDLCDRSESSLFRQKTETCFLGTTADQHVSGMDKDTKLRLARGHQVDQPTISRSASCTSLVSELEVWWSV